MKEIGEYMSSPVLTVDADSTVKEAAKHMGVNRVGALLVKKCDEYVGIITDSDMARKVIGKGLDPETTRVSEIMSQPIMSIDRYLPIEEADEMMQERDVRHLAVTEEEKIVGVLSVKDLILFRAKKP
jgi:signal-transduction protein with cAMP-binding, CBS, and nucleotidyltransferase domain